MELKNIYLEILEKKLKFKPIKINENSYQVNIEENISTFISFKKNELNHLTIEEEKKDKIIEYNLTQKYLYFKNDIYLKLFIKAINESEDLTKTIEELKNISFVFGDINKKPYLSLKNLIENLNINKKNSDFFNLKNNQINTILENYKIKLTKHDLETFIISFSNNIKNEIPLFNFIDKNYSLIPLEIIYYVENKFQNLELKEKLVNKRIVDNNENKFFEEKEIKITNLAIKYDTLINSCNIVVNNNNNNIVQLNNYQNLLQQCLIFLQKHKKTLNYKKLKLINNITNDKEFLIQITEGDNFNKELLKKYLKFYILEFSKEVNKNIKDNISYTTAIYYSREIFIKNIDKFKTYLELNTETNNSNNKINKKTNKL